MRYRALLFVCLGMLFTSAAQAQQPQQVGSESTPPISLGELEPTAQMWFYEQAMQQYHDPKAAVRAKAEYRAAQRQRRMASSKWFGVSNARPMASTTPYTSTYSPVWTSGNYNRFQWSGSSSQPIVIIQDIDEDILLRR